MNPFKSNNIVAKIIQVYAYLNAIAGVILAFILSDDVGGVVAFLWFAVVLVVSFLLYAFGEVIDLLHEIKKNTRGEASAEIPDDLPEL